MHETLGKGFVCKLCVDIMEEIVEPGEEKLLSDKVEFVKNFGYLGDRLNASGGSEAAVTVRTRVGWIR